MNIGIVGAGGWGTALGVLLHGKGHRVRLWAYVPAHVAEMQAKHENVPFLPGVPLPEGLDISNDMAHVVEDAELVVMAVPSHTMRETCRKLPSMAAPVLSVSKGIENETGKRMTEIIAEIFPQAMVAALSGPSHAEEVARGTPTAVVASSLRPELAGLVQRTFMTERFRIYTGDDLVGVELGGALKNVIAISAGITDGLGLGDNAKAALVTRGQAEISRLGAALGARQETFFGLSGIGDLMVTCFSKWSRNRGVGERLGRGETLDQILGSMEMVAEGVRTARSALALATRVGMEVPITRQVFAVLYEGKSPRQAMQDLLTRGAKPE